MKKILIFLLIIMSNILLAADTIKPMIDFNDESILSKLSVRIGTKASFETIKGEKYLKIVYPKYTSGAEQWPAVIIDNKDLLMPEAQANYSAIEVEFYNPSNYSIPLSSRIDTTDAAKMHFALDLEPNSTRKETFDLALLTSNYKKSSISAIHLFMTTPDKDYTVYIKSINFVAKDLKINNITFYNDPFNLGNISINSGLSRNAIINTSVLNNNKLIYSNTQNSRLLNFNWDGKDKDGNPAPNGKYKVICEIKDPIKNKTLKKVFNFQINKNSKSDLIFWNVPSTKKVMPFDKPDIKEIVATLNDLSKAKPVTINMAKNEFEATQIVAFSNNNKYNLNFKLDKLTNIKTKKEFNLEKSVIRQLGYVNVGPSEHRPGYYLGWYPDLLLETNKYIVNPKEPMPVWIQLKSFKNTDAGTYKGNITVYNENKKVGEIPIIVNVYNTTLPDSTTLDTIFAYHNQWTKEMNKNWTPELDREYKQFIADHRIDPDLLYKNGPMSKIDMDDLEYFIKKGQLKMYSLFNVNSTSKEEIESLAKTLDPIVAELKARGIWDKAYLYGYDEANANMYPHVKEAFSFFKNRYGNIKTIATVYDDTYGLKSGLDDVIDAWVPLTGSYVESNAKAAKKRGKEIWFYVCLAPYKPYANFMIECPSLEQRILFWQTWQHDIPGFLYYSINWWQFQKEPLVIDGNNHTNWVAQSWPTTNGDGSLFAAGPNGPVSTIRFENILDGIEDYELLTMLKKKQKSDKLGKKWADELSPSLKDYCTDDYKFAKYRLSLLKELAKK